MSLIGKFGTSPFSSDVRVACLVTDAVGNVMCIRDVQTLAGRWRVTKAQPTDRIFMPGIGILISKQTPTTGIMRVVGDVSDIFSGLQVDDDYYVGDDGGLVNPAPVPSVGSNVWVQKMGFPTASNVLRLTGESWMVLRKL